MRPREALAVALVMLLQAAVLPGDALARTCAFKRTKIVGGETARIDHWPGQATLRINSESGRVAEYFCGGTAIADRWILTAAHCVPEFLAKRTRYVRDSKGRWHEGRLEVVLGTEDLSRVGRDRVFAVDRVVMHDTYRAAVLKAQAISSDQARQDAIARIAIDVGHDIALLRLARRWTGPLAELSLGAATDPPEGAQVRAAGFGQTEHNRYRQLDRFARADGLGELYAGSRVLRQTAVEAVGQPRCQARYPGTAIGSGQLCAGLEDGGRDSCQGDSGGPLAAADVGGCPYQVGIVSWGQGCAEKQAYGVYTRISAFADWIGRHTGPLKGAPAPGRDFAPSRLSAAQLQEAVGQLEGVLGRAGGRVTIGVRGGSTVRLGAKVVFEASSTIAGRLAILDINADREVTLIYPNMYVAEGELGRIAAGADVTVPGPDYPGFTSFQAVEPLGEGRLLAIVAPPEFPIERFVAPADSLKKGFVPRNDPPGYLMRLIRQIEAMIASRTRSGAPTEAELARWAYAVAEYEIVR